MGRTDTLMRTRLALAASHAHASSWRPYEFANVSIHAHPTPKLCQVNASVDAEALAAGAEAAVRDGMKGVLKARLKRLSSSLMETSAQEALEAARMAASEAESGGAEEEEAASAAELLRSIYGEGVQAAESLAEALRALEEHEEGGEAAAAAEDGAALDLEAGAEEVRAVCALETQVRLSA